MSALATIDPRTAALLAAMQGLSANDEPITEGLDAEMAEAMEEDYGDVRARLRRIALKQGAYQDQDTGERHMTLHGIVLSKLDSQCLFPPPDEDQSEAAQNERAYWGGVSYICRTSNVKKPPELHPDLTPEQQAEAMRRRRGAKTCEGCPLAKPTKDGQGGWDAPACKGSYELLWFDANLKDYAWVRVSGSGIPNLREAFERNRRHGWFGQYPAKLASEEKKKGVRVYHAGTLEFDLPGRWPQPVIEMALRKRKELMPIIEDKIAQDNHADAHSEAGAAPPEQRYTPPPAEERQVPLVTPPAAQEDLFPEPAQDPQPARSRGLRLGQDGNPVLPGDRPPAAPPAAQEEYVPPPTDEDAPAPRRGGSLADQLGGDDW